MTPEERIKLLSDLRYDHLKMADEMEEGKDHDELHEKIDHIADEILNLLKSDFDNLTFEFIFEELTKLGGSPCLIYDDNGFFAVNGEGSASVSYGETPTDLEIALYVEAKDFKSSVREALRHYLFSE